MTDELPHLDESGAAHMVDVGHKDETHRTAVAESFVRLAPDTVDLLRRGEVKKGDALAVARIAGIAASKKTPDLIPLAHPLAITKVSVDVDVRDDGVAIRARVETRGRTGVEMEALTAASVAALALYDMIKSYERGATIERVRLLEKSGGTRGDYSRS